MTRRYTVALAGLAVAGLGACKDNDPTFVTQGAQAYVRFVNASPDSPPLTARFVDKVENWRNADGVGFRGNTGYYYAVNSGDRQLRTFRLLSNAAGRDTATVLVLDTTMTLQPNTYYTLVHTGLTLGARGTAGNTARVTVFTDTMPTVPSGSILVRVYHAAEGAGNVDVDAAASTAAANQATAGTIANVAFRTRSSYLSLPALPAADTAQLYRFTVRPTGAATSLVTARPSNFLGIPASTAPALNAVAGVRLSGSALALVVFPAAVAGSPARTAATATPTIDIFPDNIPQ